MEGGVLVHAMPFLRKMMVNVLVVIDEGRGLEQPEARNALDEGGDIVVRRRGNDCLGRAYLDETTVFHDGNAVAKADRLVKIVGDKNRRLAHRRREAHEFVLELATDQRVKCAERLVHQQDIRIGGERTGESDALLHASRELVGIPVPPARELNKGKLLLGDGPAPLPVVALDLESEGYIVAYRTVRKDRDVLEDHTDLFGSQAA